MTELAILLPVLCLILLITIDYSRLFYALTTITDCARDGALYFANHSTDSVANVTQAALADSTNLTNPAPTVTLSGPTTDANGYTMVSVTVKYEFTTLFTYPGIPSTTSLSRKVVMMVTP